MMDRQIQKDTQDMSGLQAEGGDPCCFRVGDTKVRVSFRPRGETLEEKVRDYFLGLKTGGAPAGRGEEGEAPRHGADQKAD
ncbi:MAG: hypothetical protein K2P10_01885 [Oscillospiraceae bacterium]|nr:hypothetical protein [Oscillospiraceae bacterium]